MERIVEEDQQENNELDKQLLEAAGNLLHLSELPLDPKVRQLFRFFRYVFMHGEDVSSQRLWDLIGQGLCTAKSFVKPLEISDVKRSQGRFLIHGGYAKKHIQLLLRNGEDIERPEGIEVTVYDYRGNEYTMYYKLWAEKSHILTTGWNEFRMEHDLKEDFHEITLWGFRHLENPEQRLCFLITWEEMSSKRISELQEKKKKKRKRM